MIQTLSILGGRGRSGEAESVHRVDIRLGEVLSVVGPTGSGKTTLINDLELLTTGETPSRRRVLIDGAPAPDSFRNDPARNPIALITQHTTFLSDLPVRRFLETHLRIRGADSQAVESNIARTLDFANQLTGEPVDPNVRMTELSGGQTRALLVADATVVCDTPIVLLDEVENAGIHRTRAIELLRKHRKMFIFVTHDPRIALLSDRRLVMRGGAMNKLLETDDAERECAAMVSRLDDSLARLRDQIRRGERLTVETEVCV